MNADDEFSASIAQRTRARVILAGIEKGAIRAIEVQQTSGGCEFTIVEGAHRCRAQLPVPGLHMVQNAMLAVAAGRAFGVSLEECAAGLVSAPLTKARLQIREINGVEFIDDSYNANPDSMKAALRTLMELRCRREAHCRSRPNAGAGRGIGARVIAKLAKPRRGWELIT